MTMTYDQLVTLIQDTIQSNDDTTFASHINDFIKQAEDDIIKKCQLPTMLKRTGGLAMTAGVGTIDLPSDYIATLRLEATGTARVHLRHKDSSFLTAAYPNDSSTGFPLYYAEAPANGSTNRLMIRPIPDSNYTYALRYSCRPASLTAGAGSGTTWISTNMRTALTYGALMYAAMYIEDYALAEVYEKHFNDAAGITQMEQAKFNQQRRRKEYIRPDVQDL
jgi:hypothetical protein